MLFKCGDTFTGDNATLNGTTWSVGAYGGCEGTKSGRPIFNDTGGNGAISSAPPRATGASPTSTSRATAPARRAVSMRRPTSHSLPDHPVEPAIERQQRGLLLGAGRPVGVDRQHAIELAGRHHRHSSTTTRTTRPLERQRTSTTSTIRPSIGNFVNGAAAPAAAAAGIEAFRVSACRLCVIENNTIENANNVGGVFKMHNGNTYGSVATWTGVYTELIEISDNLFAGNSGASLSDIAPQNGGLDERLRNFVIERNLYSASTTAWGGKLLMVSGANMTLRDNVFYMPGPSSKIYPILGAQVAQRGSGNLLTVQYNEVYNNTCYAPTPRPNQTCIGFDTMGARSAPSINSCAKNNLFYVPAKATGPTVDNTGSGNTVSNNTATVTNNPGFTNGSGNFSLISDFKPTANYSGGTSVPVWYDALGVPWSSSLAISGAIHQ